MRLQLIRKFPSHFASFDENHPYSSVQKNNNQKVLTILVLILAVSLIVSQSAEAKQCIQIFAYKKEKPIKVHSRQLTIWRYGGQKDFSSASHSVWKNEGDSYFLKTMGIAHHHNYFHRGSTLKSAFDAAPEALTNPGRAELESKSPGNNFLDKNQYLSISMQKTTQINEKMIEEQFEISKSLMPTQVTFFENTAVMRKSDVLRKFGKIPETARKDANANAWLDYLSHFDLSLIGQKNISPNRNIYYEVKEGTSWLISGQDPYNQKLQMPFEKAKMEVAYDRENFPFAWELGRAAATTPEGLGETLKAAAYFAYKELAILGGSIDNAFLFVHSATPLHTRLYKSIYKMQIYSKTNIKDEVVLIAPLQTLLDISPPTQFSKNLQLLHEAAPTLKPQDTVWAEQVATEKRNYFLENAKGSLITVRDFSDLAFWRSYKNVVQQFAIDENILTSQIPLRLNGRPYLKQSDLIHKYSRNESRNFSEPIPLRNFLEKHKAIEIEVSIKPGDDGKSLVEETVRHLILELKKEGHADPLKYLEFHQVKIAVTSNSMGFVKALTNQWKSVDEWYYMTFDQYNMNSFFSFAGSGFNKVKNGETRASAIFSVSDIIAGLPLPDSTTLSQGAYHQFMHLYTPELYTADHVFQGRAENDW